MHWKGGPTAYNLPNDERVTAQKGSKRVMLKNVQEAKFKSTLVPISKGVLPVAGLPFQKEPQQPTPGGQWCLAPPIGMSSHGRWPAQPCNGDPAVRAFAWIHQRSGTYGFSDPI
jgi:hypothetical protein